MISARGRSARQRLADAGGLALALLLAGCNRDARPQHEPLATAMAAPVGRLCSAHHPKESGGCVGDCQKRLAVSDARAALAAAKGLADLPFGADPRTEDKLVTVRIAAGAVTGTLGAACPADVASDAPITPEIERCYALVRGTRVIRALITAVDDLAKDVATRSGAKLPSMSTCPPG